MTEQEARDYVLADVSRETSAKLMAYVELLHSEALRQNLIAKSTQETIWSRHVADAAQLVRWGANVGRWMDIGSGAGLPGLVVALLRPEPVILVEPRRMRAAFLAEAVERLKIADQVTIIRQQIEQISCSCAIVSARAVAPLCDLFAMAQSVASRTTTWVLPKGRTAALEVASARRMWHADIKMVPSITDSEAAIIVATNVRRRR